MEDVLAKTPLEIKPRRELPRFGILKNQSSLILETPQPTPSPEIFAAQVTIPKEDAPPAPQPLFPTPELTEPEKTNVLGLETTEHPTTFEPPCTTQTNFKLAINDAFVLTPSPSGLGSFDDLLTPDDFGDQLPPGLGSVNYDLDLSDFSGENSAADDAPKEKDPFSLDGMQKSLETVATDPFSPVFESFDQFSLLDYNTSEQSDPFEVVHRPRDPCSSIIMPQRSNVPMSTSNSSNRTADQDFGRELATNKMYENKKTSDTEFITTVEELAGSSHQPSQSILDDNDSPTTASLPSPLQPRSSEKS